jgi:hypothetical protein
MAGQQLLNGFSQIFEQMETICYLNNPWRAFMKPLCVVASPISARNLHTWVIAEPVRQGRGFPVW